jgi:hypothetical protein
MMHFPIALQTDNTRFPINARTGCQQVVGFTGFGSFEQRPQSRFNDAGQAGLKAKIAPRSSSHPQSSRLNSTPRRNANIRFYIKSLSVLFLSFSDALTG